MARKRRIIKEEEYGRIARLVHMLTAKDFNLYQAGTEGRLKATETNLPRLVEKGRLKVFKKRPYIYTSQKLDELPTDYQHELTCTNILFRLYRADLFGVVIPEREFHGLGVRPEGGVKYPERKTMLVLEYCTFDNFHRAHLVEWKITRYLGTLAEMQSHFEADIKVLFVIQEARSRVAKWVKSHPSSGAFYFIDLETFLAIPIGFALIETSYFWQERIEPLRSLLCSEPSQQS